MLTFLTMSHKLRQSPELDDCAPSWLDLEKCTFRAELDELDEWYNKYMRSFNHASHCQTMHLHHLAC